MSLDGRFAVYHCRLFALLDAEAAEILHTKAHFIHPLPYINPYHRALGVFGHQVITVMSVTVMKSKLAERPRQELQYGESQQL